MRQSRGGGNVLGARGSGRPLDGEVQLGTGGGRCYRAPVAQKTEKETGIRQRQGAQADSGRVMGNRDPRTPAVRAGAPSLALGDCRMLEELKSRGAQVENSPKPSLPGLSPSTPASPSSLPPLYFLERPLGSQRTLPSNPLEN